MGKQMVQHTVAIPGETQEEPGPEAPHSAQNFDAPLAPPQARQSEHRWVKWSAAKKEREWLQFDEEKDRVLEAASGVREGPEASDNVYNDHQHCC